MPDNIDYLPIWKKDSTPYEFLQELSMIARKHPERFAKVVILYEETLPNGNTLLHSNYKNVNTNELIGLLNIVQHDIMAATRK